MTKHPYVTAIMAAAAGLLLAAPSFADYTVTGKFLYKDRAYDASGFTGATDLRPIRYADVRIIDGNGNTLASGATGLDGGFSISVPGAAGQAIRAVCLASSTATPPLRMEIRSAGSDFSLGSIYTLTSAAVTSSQLGTTIAESNVDAGKVFNMWDVMYDGMEFVASSGVHGSMPADPVTLLWNPYHSVTVSFYSSSPTRFLYIGSRSGYDDPVIYHQFGHWVADVFSKLDAPTTAVFPGYGTQDVRAAWADGLGMFIGASIRKFKGYARPDIYIITDNTNLLFSVEIESLASPNLLQSTRGSTQMLAVCAALWDITDGSSSDDGSAGVDDDSLSRSFGDVWRVITQYIPALTRPGRSVEDFWDGWFSSSINNGAATEMADIFANLNGIEFVTDTLEADDSAAGARAMTAAQVSLADGPRVVINEVDAGEIDAIELFNAGDEDVDLAGWTVAASRAGFVTALLELPSYRLRAGGFVVLSEATGVNSSTTLYFAANIPWVNGTEGACALRDRTGQGRDFVRWGESKEFPPSGTTFAGFNPPALPNNRTLGRNLGGLDTDNGSDWQVQAPSLAAFNVEGNEKHHTFYPQGDVDYASFDAVAGRFYLIETRNLGNGADTVLDLLGTDGVTVLASSDDQGAGQASRISWTAPSSGKYLLRVRRYDGTFNYARYGSYDLRVIESAWQLPAIVPEVLTVSKAGQGGKYSSIADAVAAAGNGDTVQVIDNGTYQESVSITGKTVTLRAAAGRKPVLDGRGRSARATLEIRDAKQATVDGITVLGGSRGIYIENVAAKIVNTVVLRASGYSIDPDGIQVQGSAATADVINCTVVGHGRAGMGVFAKASARVLNTIFWGNQAIDVGGDGSATSLVVKNCVAAKSNYAGKDGNISDDPKFVDAAADNYHLQSGSPALDKGDAGDSALPATDAEGLPRSLDGNGDGSAIPDMGAYEYLNPASLTTSAVFPQIAVGGSEGEEYRTSIVGVNTGTRAAVFNLSLTQSNGNPLQVTAGGTTSSGFTVVVAPQGTARLETTGTASLIAGYARMLSNVPVSGTALFKMMKGNTVLSEAGVGLSKATRRFRVYIDNLNNANSGYAVANYGSARATLTMTLRDRTGAVQQTKTLPLEAGKHVAKFAAEADQFGAAAGAGFEGSVDFTSDQDVAAVALRYDNVNDKVFSTIPVLVDEAATTLYFPQVADGLGYRTNFILINAGANAATARLEFYSDDGSPLALPVGGQAKVFHEVQVPANGVARFITDGTSSGLRVGWVSVTSTEPVGGSAIFQTVSGDRIVSEAGVASSPMASRFMTYVESLGYAASGLAICNPNTREIGITLNLRDTAGNIAASTAFTLPPRGHVARFFSGIGQWFPSGFAGFEGTLEVISSGGAVSGVALRYDNYEANVFATLPVVVIP